MKLSLTVLVSGPMHRQTIPVSSPRFLIGRDPQSDLQTASPAVHNRHCALELRKSKSAKKKPKKPAKTKSFGKTPLLIAGGRAGGLLLIALFRHSSAR